MIIVQSAIASVIWP